MIHYFYEGIIFLYIDNFRYLLITYSILLNIELGLLDTEKKGKSTHDLHYITIIQSAAFRERYHSLLLNIRTDNARDSKRNLSGSLHFTLFYISI